LGDHLKKITDETANHAAKKWVKNLTHLKIINNQINCVYRFEYNGQGFYLHMTHEKIRKARELLSAIDFQKHLFFFANEKLRYLPLV
jgi:Ser/Thr protein kinase RdoA (MazF antagonist)